MNKAIVIPCLIVAILIIAYIARLGSPSLIDVQKESNKCIVEFKNHYDIDKLVNSNGVSIPLADPVPIESISTDDISNADKTTVLLESIAKSLDIDTSALVEGLKISKAIEAVVDPTVVVAMECMYGVKFETILIQKAK